MPSSKSASEEPEVELPLIPPLPVLLDPGCCVARPVKINVPVTLPVLPKRSLCTRRKSPP